MQSGDWIKDPARANCRVRVGQACRQARVHKEKHVIQMIRRMNVTATESLVGLALGASAVVMGLLLWAIVWQSNVIAYQRDIIKWMWSSRFGG